ncbi:MAG: ABC transporter permease, partial [Lachnospiraceae bacterium]|nr:ABC transporter permease [Lachnospiraceae bacterium]
MKLSDLLLMSLESLFKRKVRTILTIMGVVIGTTSIVVMISLGIGMKEALLSEYESYGSLRSVEVESAGRYDDSGKEKNPEDTLLNDAKIEEFMSIDHVTSVD